MLMLTICIAITRAILILHLFNFPNLISFYEYQEAKTFDFGANRVGQNWRVSNDDVMGGLSKGKMRLTESTLQFEGVISLRNNGGYTFVKGPFQQYDLSSTTQVEIRYRSRNQTIGINFEADRRWYTPYYKLLLTDTEGEWKTVTLDLTDSLEYKRGKQTGSLMPISFMTRVIRLGFSNTDLKEGSFEFEVDYMTFKK